MWSTIAITDVTDELSPQELNAFNTIQGQSTTQSNILTRVVNEFRASIEAGGNQLDAAGTVPDQLRNQVIDVCLWRLLKKFPALKALQTDIRKDAYNEAMKTLKEISKKDSDYRVEPPSSATAVVEASPVNSISLVKASRPQLSRRETRGLT